MERPTDASHAGAVTPVAAAFRAMITEVSTAAADHLARCGYATTGRALRATSPSAQVATQAFELVGAYAAAAALASKFAAQALSCSQEIALRTLESQADLVAFLGDVAVETMTAPLRVTASRIV